MKKYSYKTHVVIFTNIFYMEPMNKFEGKWTNFTVLRAKTCIKLRPGHKTNDPSELFETKHSIHLLLETCNK